MKWLIIIDKYIPDVVGGNVIYIERFIKGLIELGHEVVLLASTNRTDCPEYEKFNNFEIYRIYVKEGSIGPLRFKDRNLLTQKFLSLVDNNNFDVVNTHTAYLLNLNFLRERKKKYNFKLVSTFHAVHTYELLFNMQKHLSFGAISYREMAVFPVKFILSYIFEYNSLKYADSVIVMSKYVKSTVNKFLGNKFLDKILVSAIGVSKIQNLEPISKQEAGKKLQLKPDETLFLTVRRLVPRMGLFNMIKAFSLLENNFARLLIVGKGELYGKLDKYIKKLNLQNKINLLGFVDNDLLHYYYSAADCFILPTEQLEGFGIVTIEALSYNVPVIGTPRGATPEILEKFDKNLITKSHLPEDIAEKMEYFLVNKDKYSNINYKDLVNVEYNWTSIINKIIDFIK